MTITPARATRDTPATLRDAWNETQQAGRELWDFDYPEQPQNVEDTRPSPGALTVEEAEDLARYQTRQAPSPADQWRARKAKREADRYTDEDMQALADYYAPGYRVA